MGAGKKAAKETHVRKAVRSSRSLNLLLLALVIAVLFFTLGYLLARALV